MKQVLLLGMLCVSAMAMESSESENNLNPGLLTQTSAQQEPSEEEKKVIPTAQSVLDHTVLTVQEEKGNLTQPSEISTENLITEEKKEISAEDPAKELKIKNLKRQLADINEKKVLIAYQSNIHKNDQENAEKRVEFYRKQCSLIFIHKDLIDVQEFDQKSMEKFDCFIKIVKNSYDQLKELEKEFALYQKQAECIEKELQKLTEQLNPQNKKEKDSVETILLDGRTLAENLSIILSAVVSHLKERNNHSPQE